MAMYTISGRIVSPDGAPVESLRVSVKQLASLATGPTSKGFDTTGTDGAYIVSWSEASTPASPWDLFVEADDLAGTVIESRLITDLASSATVDIVFGSGTYTGGSEWERVSEAVEGVLSGVAAKDVLASRLEWVSRRADVYPTLVAMYLQAHRLSDGRTVKEQTCYACLRHGLPSDLPGLLRAGRPAWEDALRTAWARRIVPLPGDGSSSAQDAEVTVELAAIDELVVDNAVYASATGVNRYKILESGGLIASEQRTFTQIWLAHQGTLAQFWQSIRDEPSLGASKATDLQFTLQATTLVGNHLATLTGLQTERGVATIATVADLTAWDQSTWDSFVTTHVADPPSEITGVDTPTRQQNYARALPRLVEDAYPTQVLRHSLNAEVSPPTHTTELVGFFDNNAAFDITRTNISGWVAANATAFSYATDATQARADLEIAQRVFRITPRLGRYATAKALLDGGITSAADVAAYTRDEFRETFSSAMPSDHHGQDELAEEVWDNATRIHGSALAMASNYGLAKSGAAPRPVQNIGVHSFAGAGNGLEALDAILGDLDYCACKHCRSVFSPAAYLADLLKFLDDRTAQSPYGDALEVIRERRPDLEHILLDCANTNTVLPQIDLAIELLERKFADTFDASSPQTTWSAEQLCTHPEHILAGVYEDTLPNPGTKLSEYVHPWALPFSLPHLESRTYLEHLGSSREQLMRLLVNGSGTPLPASIAAEALGLSTEQWQIITDNWPGNTSTDDREFWGYKDIVGDDEWVGVLSGLHADPMLRDPGELLRRGDYELDELIALLELTFIDPLNYGTLQQRIEFSWSETCSLAGAQILNLDAPALARLHRFTRLQRATQIPARMLNLLIEQVGGGVLDETFLTELPRVIALHERTRLDYDVLATWWSDKIDAQAYADGQDSLYHRRFLTPELHAGAGFEPSSAYGLALDGDADVLLSEAELSVLLAATRLSASDYATLITAPGTHVFTAADIGKFQFRFFAELMRAASFTRALRLSAKEFVILARLFEDMSGDLFESPTHVLDILELVDRLRASGLPLTQLAWLLRHDDAEQYTDDEGAVERALAELARGLRTIAAETGELVDPDGVATKLNLASVIADSNTLDVAMAFLANTSVLEAAQEGFIDTNFASFIDTAAAKAALVTPGASLGDLAEDAPARYAWVLREFVASSRKRTLVTDVAARELSIEAAAADALLFTVLTDPLTGPQDPEPLAQVFLADFASEEQIAAVLTSTTHPDEFKAWTRLSKAAVIVRTLAIDPKQIRWYSKHADWVNLDGLPLTTSDPKVSVQAWSKLLQAMEVRKLFATADGHERLEDTLNISAAVAVLVEANEWDAVALETLLDIPHLNWPLPTDLGAPEQLIRLRELAGVAARTGASLLRLWSWIHPSGTEFDVANEIKAAARAQHDEATWAKVAPPLRDKIRVVQRDALVAANLAADPSLPTRDALSQYLLIDVAMSPCMKTSRIKQAISSAQLFIHRTFVRLEADKIKFKEEHGDLWSWMKNYRVWEANRKVFLYPENWIVPGLRGDKTPQFEALESSLMQDTLDDARVERSLSGYLEALDTVSNLEIVGIWSNISEAGSGGSPAKDIWVLGRTQNAPHEYYIRHRAKGGDWRPWEAVPLNIEGDNVALVRHQDRLFLFWLVIHDATSSPGQENSSFDAKHLAIGWSERTQEGWSRISMSERSHAFPDAFSGADPERFRLQFWNLSDGIRLLVMRQKPDKECQPLATFDYDAISKHIYFSGAYFDADDPDNAAFIDGDSNLKDKGLIALQSAYSISGQRYVKTGPWRVIPANVGVRFHQGHFEGLLFKKSPRHGPAALLHQADLWDPDHHNSSKYCPVVYDDRRHKYLLEPTTDLVGLGTEGDDLDPVKLGIIGVANYLECAEPLIATPMNPGSERRVAQLARDKITVPKVFSVSGVVPGQELALVNLYEGEALFAPKGGEEAIYANATNGMKGKVGYDDGNDVDPDVFQIKMAPLYHPYVHDLIHRLSRYGLPGIYDTVDAPDLGRQLATATPLDSNGLSVAYFRVWGDAPVEKFDFDFASTYGIYNWEIFYHAPTLIADKLTTDQRFEEAQNWLHRIFDPIRVVEGEDGPEKFWRIKPFYEQATAIAQDQIEAMLGIGVSAAAQAAAVEAFEDQVAMWRDNPFDPHAIARVRPGVYQRALLMQYFDNLIAWADNLFRRDTIESINEATMLYMLVGQLLGDRPREVPGPDAAAKSYDDLATLGFDAFTNAAVQLENWVVLPTRPAKLLGCNHTPRPGLKRHNVPIRFWYFCYPPNPKLLEYWNVVEDRLWKIRHCQNIEGVERQLALFQPPIDPALLVQATAAGVDLASALAELDSGLPPYRFRYVWGRAQSITGELRSLGGALLSALEKRDGEELASLRAGQEVSLLEAVRQVRLRRIEEAEASIESLRLAQATIEHRRDHYIDLGLAPLLGGEQDNLDKLEQARNHQISATVHRTVGSVLNLIPNFIVGLSPGVNSGGSHLGAAVSAMGDMFSAMSSEHSYQAGKALTNAQYARRGVDWQFQAASASKEFVRLDQDIATAEIRLAISQRELADHDLQVNNARDVQRYMHDKYTDRQLYDWMVGQLSTLYFQTYQLAFDLAKRAERAYRHELAILEQPQPIIKYGYWDSLRKGLLAGERLSHDLARLDIAYMDKDKREYELRKSVSLAQLDPLELLRLQETGECDISVPEFVYDLDHPGHYLRRTRAVRLTIPAVVGPYTTLGATLQLVSHDTRLTASLTGGYASTGLEDERFVRGYGNGQSIATSTAVADAGVFSLDFKDERYLPFEYTGAVSTWTLRLPDPSKAPQFDYRTISDVVMHVDYTAREGGTDLRDDALIEVETILEAAAPDSGVQLFVVQQAFPVEWEKFLSPGVGQTTHALTLPISARHFPYFAQRKGFSIDQLDVHLILDPSASGTVTGTDLDFFDDADADPPGTPATDAFAAGTHGNTITANFTTLTASAQPWRLEIDTTTATIPAGLDPDSDGLIDRSVVAGMILVAHYSLTPS